MKKNEHKGQVALVLVLIMTVASALAVSLASRSTVDTRIQQTESESVRALILAQTGLEQMVANQTGTVTGTGYTAVSSETGSESLTMNGVGPGSTLELNLSEADFGMLDGFIVNWGPDSSSPGGEPAVLISRVYETNEIDDQAFDYDGNNGFTRADINAGVYARTSGFISLTQAVTKIRITVLGSPAMVQVLPVGGGSFPAQLLTVRSTGSVESDTKEVKYGLQYDESSSVTVPGIFDYALFSGGSIVQ